MLYKRILTSATSVLIAASLSTPAFALSFDTERMSRRSVVNETENYNRLEHRKEMQSRSVRKSPTDAATTQHRLLRGTILRRQESNSQPKEGTSRYRQLNISLPNTRGLRKAVESTQSSLPMNLVVTGSSSQEDESASFDRPSRRSIRGDRDFNGSQE